MGDFARTVTSQDLIDNFGYMAGDTIQFRVAAKNTWGRSEFAYPNISNMVATTLELLI